MKKKISWPVAARVLVAMAAVSLSDERDEAASASPPDPAARSSSCTSAVAPEAARTLAATLVPATTSTGAALVMA